MQTYKDPATGVWICGDELTMYNITPPVGWVQCEQWTTFGSSSRRCTTRMQESTGKKYCYEHERTQHSIAHKCLYYACKEYVANTETWCATHTKMQGNILDLARETITPPVDGEDWVDGALESRVARSTALKYRHYRKLSSMETIHYKIELKGKADDLAMFHAILGEMDHDYPFRPDRDGTTVPACTKCHGYVWKGAIVTPEEMKRCAKQVGAVYVKTKHYITEKSCGGSVKEVAVGAA